jgi:hypothetical protein
MDSSGQTPLSCDMCQFRLSLNLTSHVNKLISGRGVVYPFHKVAMSQTETTPATVRCFIRAVVPVAEGKQILPCYFGFEILTEVVMKSSVFWNVTA